MLCPMVAAVRYTRHRRRFALVGAFAKHAAAPGVRVVAGRRGRRIPAGSRWRRAGEDRDRVHRGRRRRPHVHDSSRRRACRDAHDVPTDAHHRGEGLGLEKGPGHHHRRGATPDGARAIDAAHAGTDADGTARETQHPRERQGDGKRAPRRDGAHARGESRIRPPSRGRVDVFQRSVAGVPLSRVRALQSGDIQCRLTCRMRSRRRARCRASPPPRPGRGSNRGRNARLRTGGRAIGGP